MKKDVDQVLTNTFEEIVGLNLGFTSVEYAKELFDTYVRTIKDVCEHFQPGAEILEIGCFNCVVTVTLKRLGYDMVAADMALITQDQKLRSFLMSEGIELHTVDLEKTPLPFEAGSFDGIVCCEVVEHLPFNPIPVFHEFRRLLKVGGLAYIATPNLASLTHRISMLRGRSVHNTLEHFVGQLDPDSSMSLGIHWKEYTKQELNDFLAHSGFSLVKHRYHRYLERTQSGWVRRAVVSMIYGFFPQWMQCQVGVYRKAAGS